MGLYDLAYKKFTELPLIGSNGVSADQIPISDVSAKTIKRITVDELAALIGIEALGNAIQYARVTATQTELNAGIELIAAVAGKQILVTSLSILVAGNFATGTSIEVEDESANEVISYAQAQLSDGAILAPDSTGATLKAGFGAPLTVSEALDATKTGSNFTAGTSIIFTISYALV